MRDHPGQIRTKAGALLRRFKRDARGNVAIVTALCAIPLFIAAGVAIDVARASRSQSALQVAVDAAALAAAASDTAGAVATTTAQKDARKATLKKMAESFLKANYQDVGQDVTVEVEVTDQLITVVGRKAFPTSLMNLAGFKNVALSASAEVNMQGGIAENIEIVLVMDITGSMKGTKLSDAKSAAKSLIKAVLGDEPSDAKVKFSLVPFSVSVNVGADKLNSGWIDTTGKAAVSKANFMDINNPSATVTYHNMKAWNDLKYRNSAGKNVALPWNGCVEARLGALATNDTAPSSTTGDTLFTPYFAPDEPNIEGYSNSYISDGTSSSNETYRLRNQAKYAGQVLSSNGTGSGPWANCAPTAIIPLTGSRATIEAGIDAMEANGPTNLVEGIMWGWRVLSPGAPYTEGHSFTDKEWRKVVVMMTDGENDVGTNGSNWPPAATGTNYTAFGYSNVPLAKNRFGSTSQSLAKSKLDAAFKTGCTNLKAFTEMRDRGGRKLPSLEVYAIGFQVKTEWEQLLKDCASDPELNGGQYKYYVKADNKTELEGAFKAIGARLRTLYLSK